MTNNNIAILTESSPSKNLENLLWDALELDEFSNEMIYGSLTGGNAAAKGTGHTVNACNMCSSNSNTTAGCRTCC